MIFRGGGGTLNEPLAIILGGGCHRQRDTAILQMSLQPYAICVYRYVVILL